MQVLVVGANGQLGFGACAELSRHGHQVRGSVRRVERGSGLSSLGVEVVVADPGSAQGMGEALADVDALLLTANVAAPRSGDDLEDAQRSFERIVADAEAAGVRRFCLVSLPRTAVGVTGPLERGKARIEELLADSDMEHVVLRFPPFMEVWLALVGSSLPTRGEEHASVDRSSPFLQRFRKMTSRTVEDHGLMLVPGPPDNRNAFISIPDVARACVAGVERDDLAGQDREVGGPEVLSWNDVARTFGEVVGRRVRVLSTPGSVYGVMAKALAPFAPVPSATMALNQMAAATETPWAPGGGGVLDPGTLVTVREFLEVKARLPV